nr:proteoglycan 4 [Ciona intestinalis]|eukprot:XP_018668550.1 proteoglycan 4 [Ciona intestinalis]
MDVVEAATFPSQTDHIQHEVKDYLSTSTNETLLKESDDKVMDSKPQDSSFEISNDSFSSDDSSVYASPVGDLNEAETKINEKHKKQDENENNKIAQMDIEEQTRNQTEMDKQHEKLDENIDITEMEIGKQTETGNKTDKLNEKTGENMEVLQMEIDKQNTNETVMKTKINEVKKKLEQNAGNKQIDIDKENTTGVVTTPKGNEENIAEENTAVKTTEKVLGEILDEKNETTLQGCQPSSTDGKGEGKNNGNDAIIKQEADDMNESLSSIEELQIDEDLKPETSVENMKIKQEIPDVTASSEPLVSNTATSSVTTMSSLMENELFKILSQDQTPISSPILSLPCSSITTDTGTSSKTGVAVKTTVIPTSHPSGPQNRKRAKEVFLVKSIQTQEKPSITTAKAKIRPIFDDVNPKNKSNAFPIIYIGAPNILDMQAYRKQVKAEEEASAKKLPEVPTSYLDEETGQMVVTKAENKPTPTVSNALKTIPLDTNTSSITKNVTSTTSTGKPFKFIVASKQDQFSVRKTMKAFLPDGEMKEIRTKSTFSVPLSKSLVTSVEDDSSPSMVYTSPLDNKKPAHKPLVYPKPIRIDKPGNKVIPASTKISTVSVKCTPVTPTVLKPTTPVVLPIPTSSESGRPFKLIVRKRSPMNQDGKTVLPKVTISTATLSTTSSTIKVVKPDANQVYKWKLQKPMNKSEIVQVLKPNLAKTSSPSSFKPTVTTIPTTAVNKQEIPTTKVVTVSKPLIKTGGAILPKKVDQLVKSKERRFTRKGMLVMFEDGVKQWVDSMRNVTYADDEPIKSWRVKPGTKVAVKYSDGLFYDAEVISSYDGSSTTEADTAEKKPVEIPQPKTPVPPIKKVNNILNRPVRKTQTIEVKNKVIKLPNQPEDPKPLSAKDEEIATETNLAKKRTPVVKYQKRNLKRKLSPPPIETAASESDEQPVLKVPRVHIKKMAEKYTVSCESDVSDETDKQQSVAHPPSTASKADNSEGEVIKTKCPTCFLVFTDESDFNRHHKSVCHAQGVSLTVRPGGVLSITTPVEVDENAGPPPIFATELKKREDAESKEEEYVPRSPGGKRLFRRGTRILHRWQTPKGSSRWYNGKILRLLPNKVGKSEFEVEYTDDDHDVGPYAVTLCDDYPHDIRVIIR